MHAITLRSMNINAELYPDTSNANQLWKLIFSSHRFKEQTSTLYALSEEEARRKAIKFIAEFLEKESKFFADSSEELEKQLSSIIAAWR